MSSKRFITVKVLSDIKFFNQIYVIRIQNITYAYFFIHFSMHRLVLDLTPLAQDKPQK